MLGTYLSVVSTRYLRTVPVTTRYINVPTVGINAYRTVPVQDTFIFNIRIMRQWLICWMYYDNEILTLSSQLSSDKDVPVGR